MKPTQALPEYFADRHSAIGSKQTRRKVALALDLLAQYTSSKPLERISGDDLVGFLAWRPWASATVANYRSLLLAFFDWATWKGYAPLNPSATVRQLVKVKVQPVRTHNWLTVEEAQAVLDACRDGSIFGKRDEALILTGVYTGLRASEVVGLRWGAIDLNAGHLTVVGKGGKLAQVGISKRLLEILFEWRGECAKGLGRPPAAGDPVFPRGYRDLDGTSKLAWDKAGGYGVARTAVMKRGELAGIPSLRPHDLRRTFAGWLEEQEGLLETSRLMRHSNVGTTQRYLESNPRKVIEKGRSLDFGL